MLCIEDKHCCTNQMDIFISHIWFNTIQLFLLTNNRQTQKSNLHYMVHILKYKEEMHDLIYKSFGLKKLDTIKDSKDCCT